MRLNSMPKKINAKNIETSKTNVWKVVSIVFIVIFAVILVTGLVRIIAFHPQPEKATPGQIASAKTLAENDLTQRNENTSGYSIKTADNLKRPLMRNANRTIEVSFYNETVRHLYIIDVDNGKILLYSKTQFYDTLNHSNPLETRREPRFPFI
jgi:hypothetical protein